MYVKCPSTLKTVSTHKILHIQIKESREKHMYLLGSYTISKKLQTKLHVHVQIKILQKFRYFVVENDTKETQKIILPEIHIQDTNLQTQIFEHMQLAILTYLQCNATLYIYMYML